MNRWVDQLAYIRDKLRTTRTAALVFCFYLNYEVFMWVMRVVENQIVTQEWMTNGLLTTSAALTGAVFKFYAENHSANGDKP